MKLVISTDCLSLTCANLLICNLKFLFSLLLPSSKLKRMSLEILLLKVRFLGSPQCINKLWYFCFVSLCWSLDLLNDILALYFP